MLLHERVELSVRALLADAEFLGLRRTTVDLSGIALVFAIHVGGLVICATTATISHILFFQFIF